MARIGLKPSPTGAAACAPGAVAWLRGLADTPRLVATDCASVLRAFILEALCADLGIFDLDLSAFLEQRIAQQPLEAVAGCGGELVLLAALALQRQGRTMPETMREYVDVARSVQSPGGAPAPIRFLLRELGVETRGCSYDLAVDPKALLGAPKPKVRRAVAAVAAATGFGTRVVNSPDGLPTFLGAIAMERLQRYDLEFAASVMRVRSYLNSAEDLASIAFREFVTSQQDAEGSFGIFARESELLAQTSPDVDAALALSLPTTLSVLWALAEMDDPGYRLYRDVGSR